MKAFKVVVIIFFFIVGMTLVLENPRPSSRVSRTIKEDIIETISLKTFQQLRVYVKAVHKTLDNELEGNGKIQYNSNESYKWQESERTIINLEHDLIRAMAIINDSSTLYHDLGTAKELLKYSRQNKDLQALIDAHNIVHDLEHFFFYHDRSQQYFGVTKTLSGSTQHRTVFSN